MSIEQNRLGSIDPILIDKAEQVEALPHSRAFEHTLYENRLARIVNYHYASAPNGDDIDPIKISPQLLQTNFPYKLRGIFSRSEYTISYLEITQNDTPSEQTIGISFYANDTPHSIAVTQESIADTVFTSVKYGTVNNSLENVLYTDIEAETIVGLIAAFVYARQYSDEDRTRPIEVDDSNIITERPENTDLVERMIMTLGEFSGTSTTKTTAVLDSTLLVSHSETERSTVSGIDSTINITELNPSVTMNTDVVQKLVNLKQGTPLVPAGITDLKYAEIRSTSNIAGIALTEHIDPENNFQRWAYLCGKLLDAISQPMEKYRDLDNFSPLE